MYQAYEQCSGTQAVPRPGDSVQSLCWPNVQRHDPRVPQRMPQTAERYNSENANNWPMAEPWRRNTGQPRCGGQGRCQGEARRCNSKYQHGVDDVGRCPSHDSCTMSYSCRYDQVPHPNDCPMPCRQPLSCNRPTTRCFEWPTPKQEFCVPPDPNVDHRPPRPNIVDPSIKPECCPTCHRTLVDLACGPLGINYEN